MTQGFETFSSTNLTSPDVNSDIQTEMIQNIIYEFRTPLAILLGYTDLLYDEAFGKLTPKQEQAINLIQDRALELRTLIERITLLTCLDLQQDFVSVSLSKVVTEIVERQHLRAQVSGLTMVYYQQEEIPIINGYAEFLEHAFECVIENSIKFTPQNGQIEIKLYQEGDNTCFVVTDTGIGIPYPSQNKIFDAFYQEDGSATREYSGLGLGLTLVKAVVKKHGGQIEVHSQPKKGTQLVIKIPTVQPTETMTYVNQTPLKPKQILVVDDERMVGSLLKEALQQLPNCEVTVVNNAELALQLFERNIFDLLITDYNLPGVNGIALSTRIRRLRPKTPIILLTGFVDETVQGQANEISIDQVLSKPVRLKDIRSAASQALLDRSQLT